MIKMVVTRYKTLVGEFIAPCAASTLADREFIQILLDDPAASQAPATAESKPTFDSIRGQVLRAGSTWVFETNAAEIYIRKLPEFAPLRRHP